MYLKNNLLIAKQVSLILILGFVLLSNKLKSQTLNSNPQLESDTSEQIDSVKSKEKVPTFTYYRIGIDLTKIAASFLQNNYNVFEAQADVYYKKDLYFAAEFGYGNSKVSNQYLNYKSNNTFIRLGLDKTFFGRDFKGDFDNAFVGLRYGLAFINRGESTYAIEDIIWGNTNGIIPSESFLAHWLELTGGFRMELVKNIFVGWNARVKTFINPKKFELLPPSYVAGYGRGDKNTAFSYNLYLLYGFGKR